MWELLFLSFPHTNSGKNCGRTAKPAGCWLCIDTPHTAGLSHAQQLVVVIEYGSHLRCRCFPTCLSYITVAWSYTLCLEKHLHTCATCLEGCFECCKVICKWQKPCLGRSRHVHMRACRSGRAGACVCKYSPPVHPFTINHGVALSCAAQIPYACVPDIS